ncbi:MAG: hypothetical protein IJW92_03010 [Clostridia bacterium]|nr:hypothetical protein [Clostridia bacterium]
MAKTKATLNQKLLKRLPELLQRYTEWCRPQLDKDAKKQTGTLPNLAGFCRFLGCGISEMEALQEKDPLLFDRICAALEDELINCAPSPTILHAYLKKRLGYGDEKVADKSGSDSREVKLVFEHDIAVDGV